MRRKVVYEMNLYQFSYIISICMYYTSLHMYIALAKGEGTKVALFQRMDKPTKQFTHCVVTSITSPQ